MSSVPGGELYVSAAQVFVSGILGFMAATQGMPLDSLALVIQGNCIPGSHRTLAMRQMVLGKLPSLRQLTDRILRHIPQSSCKGDFFVLELWPEE